MVGTYAVAFELSRQGWLVMPTYGIAPGIDLFASRADRTVPIQVRHFEIFIACDGDESH